MKFAILTVLVSSLGVTGCAHNFMRGTVAMKASDREAYVCLGNNEVKEGEKVAFFKSVCQSGGASRPSTSAPYVPCQKLKIGEGRVTRLINEHYSVVEPVGQIKFEEGMIVETL